MSTPSPNTTTEKLKRAAQQRLGPRFQDAYMVLDIEKFEKYSPDQPRDSHGRFGEDGGGKKYSDKQLISIGKTAGEKLYGKKALIFDSSIERMSYNEYNESMNPHEERDANEGAPVDTFDYVFFPSNGTAVDAADTPLSSEHVDTDGKIYIAGSNGVLVLSNPPFKTKKLAKTPIDDAAHEAAASTRNDHEPPTDRQKHAGNYKKGHISVSGIDIAIENPAGSRRQPQWPVLKAHYGYIKRTIGADQDQIDVFVRPGISSSYKGPVYVIDQLNQKMGEFDENKTVIGFRSKQKAVACYLNAYALGWKIGPVHKLSWIDFKKWVVKGQHDGPLAEELK